MTAFWGGVSLEPQKAEPQEVCKGAQTSTQQVWLED